MNLSDFAQVKKNLKGRGHKKKSEPKIENTKGKFCHHCGFKIKSAIMRSIFFDGDYCVDCVKEMPK